MNNNDGLNRRLVNLKTGTITVVTGYNLPNKKPMGRSEKEMKAALTKLQEIKKRDKMSTGEKQRLSNLCGITLSNLYNYMDGKISKLQVALKIIDEYEKIYGEAK